MRLKREVSRRRKDGTPYGKWRVTLPEATIKALGWADGDELDPSAEGGALVIRQRKADKKD